MVARSDRTTSEARRIRERGAERNPDCCIVAEEKPKPNPGGSGFCFARWEGDL